MLLAGGGRGDVERSHSISVMIAAARAALSVATGWQSTSL
jgi:hypothetical protein